MTSSTPFESSPRPVRSERVAFRLTPPQLAWIDRLAAGRNVSRSDVLRLVLAGEINPTNAPGPGEGPLTEIRA